MKIGIDIRKYDDYGIGTYIQQLLDVLTCKDDLDFTFFAYPDQIKKLQPVLRGTFIPDTSGLYSLRELWSLSEKANKGKIQIFHAPHYTLPFFLNMPSVVTIHDIIHLRMHSYFSSLQRMYAAGIMRHACAHSSAVIVNSEFTKNEVLDYFKINEKKVFVTRVGVAKGFSRQLPDEQKNAFRLKYGLKGPFFLYTGSLKPHKNLPVLLKAFSKTLAFCSSTLLLVGESLKDVPVLQYLADSLSLNGRILSIGKISQAELYAAYQNAEALILPSWYEGFGFPLVEAMASRIPVIGARGSAITEVVGDAGLLFDPRDENDLAAQMKKIMENSDLRESLKEKGYQRSLLFSYERCAQETLEVYKTVCA